ncbi:DUF6221 family protein [Nocardia sp. NPDC004711]
MTIEKFIEARLAERAAAANKALDLATFFPPDEFDLDYQWVRFTRRRVRSVRRPGEDLALSSSFAPGAPSPREVLRECAALRVVLEFGAALISASQQVEFENDVLLPVASIWAEHPDYRTEWTPPRNP